ncbi:FkbM family methyltransferase [Aquicoccus sp. SCR17]|nr:FkbM family methyltransferase [Carideicomes alvinocaridis]
MITPVGPGHDHLLLRSSAPSLAQARAYHMGPFTEIEHYVMDDREGRHGRSNRRNDALRQARAAGIDWVYFLDADDRITPNAFEAFGRVIAAEPDLDAVWGMTCTFFDGEEPELRDGQPVALDTRAELLRHPPLMSLNIGHFVRTECAARFGFDPHMDAGEDFRFYFQLWEHCRCAKRPEIFFLHRRGEHSQGPRSATGEDWTRSVTRQWQQQLAEVEVFTEIEDGIEPPAQMRLTNPADLIQNAHVHGRYFEASSLDKLRRLLDRPAPSILEVGANIGNHVVWYARHLNPSRIYPVEPAAQALDLLEQNIAANGIGHLIDRRGLGLGAGRGEGTFRTEAVEADNLGATRLVPDAAGGIATRSLDALMGEDRVDFIKIDAEGMELDVLAGAEALIARDRPLIWVEVRRGHMMDFAQAWCRRAGYRLVDSQSYLNTIDYFAMPKD